MEKYTVTLTAQEAEQLQALVAKGKHAAAKVINALILLNCDETQARGRRRSSQEIAEVLQVSPRKIDRIKRRFVEEGLEVALNGRCSMTSGTRRGTTPNFGRRTDQDQSLEMQLPNKGKGSEQEWISKPNPAEAARTPRTCLETSEAT